MFDQIYNNILQRADIPNIQLTPFNGKQAYEFALLNASIKQRYSGSIGNKQSIQTIKQLFQKTNIPCKLDIFNKVTPIGQITFRNLVVDFTYNQKNPYIIIGCHHDTKYLPKEKEFSGANDGASGVGLLIQLILYLAKSNLKFKYNLKFIFFDGQECFYQYNQNDGLYGSKYAAKLYHKNCKAMILVDMIGAQNLKIQFPSNSDEQLIMLTKSIINKNNYQQYFNLQQGNTIIDDTNPFEKYNIPTINFIDFQYQHWHTNNDTIDKLQQNSFSVIGNVILKLIKAINFN